MKKRGMYAAIVTGAIFTGVVASDLIQSNLGEVLKHGLLGLIAISAIVILSVNGAELAAWGLLSIPLVTFLVGFGMVLFEPKPTPVSKPYSPTILQKPSKLQTPAAPHPPLPNVEQVCVKVPCPATSSSSSSLPAPSTCEPPTLPPSSAPSTCVPPTPPPPTCIPGVPPTTKPSVTPSSGAGGASIFPGGSSTQQPSTSTLPSSAAGFNITPVTTCGI